MTPGASLFRRTFLALLCALAVVPFTLPSAQAQVPGECGRTSGLWRSLEGPVFGSGGQAITAMAVDPFNPNLIYISNGIEVWVSGDGGCTWTVTFQGATSIPGALASYKIEKIVSPRPATVVLMIEEMNGPRIIFSVDDGQTWQNGGAGLPPLGDPEFLEYPAASGAVLYLGVDAGGGAVDLLYASTDQGATFTLRSDLTRAIPNAGITGVEVDPISAEDLWAYGDGGLYRSNDGGAGFAPVDEFTGDVLTTVDVWHLVGTQARILAFRGGGGSPPVGVSFDGGETWGNIVDAPYNADSAASGRGLADVMVSARGRAYMADIANVRFVNAGAPDAPVSGFVSTITNPTNYFGFTPRSVLRYVRPEVPRTLFDLDIDVSIVERPELALSRAAFGPEDRKIKLGEGERKTIPYRLELPPRPVPLDVFFLVDTSSSMTQPLAGIARSLAQIAQQLEDRRVDVEFGLGEYRSYPDKTVPRPSCQQAPPATPGGCEANYLYKKLADIGVDVQVLAQAIEMLQPAAGGRVDAQLPALHTLATGEAQDVHPIGVRNENGTDVPPGQQAHFREKALKVVIHVTDEPLPRKGANDQDIGEGSTQVDQAPWPENMPTVSEVTEAFRARGIYHLSIALGDTENVVEDMSRLARETNTIARDKPVDCNGDGRPDISVGAPLVCRLAMDASDKARYVVPAVVNLLSSIQDRDTVSLDVTRGERVVVGIAPRERTGVVLQTANVLDFEVTYRCPIGSGGEEHHVRIAPAVGQSTIDELTLGATVVCTEEPEVLPVTAVAPLVAIPLFPAAPPPPPAPVSQAQPVTQSQAQAQGAAAQQEQEEPQLATVHQQSEDLQEEELYAMVAYDRGEIPAGVTFGLGVVSVSLMYLSGLALRRRFEQRSAYRYNR